MGEEFEFEFDGVFQKEIDQMQLYEAVQPMVDSFLKGNNSCIFAYGQSGSGKSYTMGCTGQNRGLISFCSREIFDKLENEIFSLKVSFIEVN